MPITRHPLGHWPTLRAAMLVGMGALCLLACQAPIEAAPAVTDEAALLARIRTAIGDARCDSDAACRTLAIGEKACGGPEQWWAYSARSARADQLPGWAFESAALARQRNANSGMVSNCLFNANPGAVCLAGRCSLAAPPAMR